MRECPTGKNGKISAVVSIMSPFKRFTYAGGMIGVTSMLLVPLDLAVLHWGLHAFFTSPWIFLLLIPFWFIAPWLSDILPYNNDDDDDD